MDKRIYIGAFLLWAIGFGMYAYLSPKLNRETIVGANVVRFSNTSIPVELAITSKAQQKGLSGRASLSQDSGMLFIFDHPAFYRFWMPDMHFPIDIIWIRDKKVVDISAEVTNAFDPIHPVYYIPREKAEYVLEVNAGFAEKKDIKIGDPVLLP